MQTDAATSEKIKVLVTDDDAELRDVICRFLELADHEPIEASNGVECIKQLRANKDVQLLVLDVIMPEQEGIETLTQVREEFPQLKLLMVSGGGRTQAGDYLNMAKSLGAHETLAKPFRAEQFLDTVNRLLEA